MKPNNRMNLLYYPVTLQGRRAEMRSTFRRMLSMYWLIHFSAALPNCLDVSATSLRRVIHARSHTAEGASLFRPTLL